MKIKTFIGGEVYKNEIADQCNSWPEYAIKCTLFGVELSASGIYSEQDFKEYKTYSRFVQKLPSNDIIRYRQTH